jgi:hypothetical protein
MQVMIGKAFGVQKSIFSGLAMESSGCYWGTVNSNMYTK